MSETKMLLGSLSNDLYRIATLAYRGSDEAANKFLTEAKRWSNDLENRPLPQHIQKIVLKILAISHQDITKDSAEDFLMYSILLQNHTLKIS